MDKVDLGGYAANATPHNNPPRKVAGKGPGDPPIDVDGDFVVNQVNTKGTGSLKGQPLAQKRKSTLPNPQF